MEDLVGNAVRESEENSTSRLERNRRLEAAKKQSEKLLDYLNIWWSTLEEGVPELETEMDTHPFQRGRKRKRRNGANGKERKLESKETVNMATNLVEEMIEEVSIQHDCGYNPACPAWYCCMICDKLNVMKQVYDLSEYIKILELSEEKVEETKNIRIEVSITEPEAAMDTSEAPTPVPSPVKDIMCVKSMELGQPQDIANPCTSYQPADNPEAGQSNGDRELCKASSMAYTQHGVTGELCQAQLPTQGEQTTSGVGRVRNEGPAGKPKHAKPSKPVKKVKKWMRLKSAFLVGKLLMLGRGCQNHRATKIQTTKPLPTHLTILR